MQSLYIKIFILLTSINVFSQSIVDDFSQDSSSTSRNYELANESILKASISRKIYLITNKQDSFTSGDYITILVDKKPIARGLVAKNISQQSAVKITKIYSLELYKVLSPGLNIQVIRGDDSYYTQTKPKDSDQALLDEEDSLYDDTSILGDESSTLERNSKEVIKNDNVVSAAYAQVSGKDASGEDAAVNQFNISWSYQIDENIFIEALWGNHVVQDFPDAGFGVEVVQYIFRAKYAFQAPLHSIILPYVGYKLTQIDNPGESNQTSTEIASVEDLKDSGPVFGITVLKRLVPGWFIKGDLGNDMLSLGLALEF